MNLFIPPQVDVRISIGLDKDTRDLLAKLFTTDDMPALKQGAELLDASNKALRNVVDANTPAAQSAAK